MNRTDEINPTSDWHLMLIVSVVLLVACVAWSAVVYYEALYGPPIQVIPPVSGDADALRKMQSIFDARAVEKANYESTYHFVDPSQK